MARITGPGHQGRPGRAVGEQPGVVPAVPQCLFGRARGALHHQRRGSRNGRGQVLAQPGLRGARHAQQQQRPVCGKRRDGDFDEPGGTQVLWGDLGAVRQGAAKDVSGHRPRGQPPAGRPGPVVDGRPAPLSSSA